MLPRLFCLAMLTLALATSAGAQEGDRAYADEDFPYRAYINADDVYVRSGPGQNYYPVLRMNRGETVEVFRHDPGGWYAIRPPADCFSWISAEFVEPGEGRMATIKGDRVVARVGSAFSDIRDVIQVRLDAGELVEVLEAKRIGTGPAAQTWYKVLPPAGEFRWVSGQFISHEKPTQANRARDPNNNLLIARHAQRGSQQDESDDLPSHREAPSPGKTQKRSNRPAPDDDDYLEDPTPRQAEHKRERLLEPADAARSVSRHAPMSRHEAAEPAPRQRTNARPVGDPGLLEELEKVDQDLSVEVAKDPSLWNLRPLRTRTESLLSASGTALDRGRVRLVQRKVARFEDIKQRHDAIASSQLATDQRNQDALRGTLGGSLAQQSNMRYDGTGKLTQIDSTQSGVASFALVDREGRVTQYVTPAPGVNLRPYLGQDVGVQGTLGYMADARTPHVTAKRVNVINASTAPLRR